MVKSLAQLLAIGNPGTGKSTALNCYAGAVLFVAAPSTTGFGVTYQLDINEHDGKRYLDTPGLSDLVMRQKAAEAIDKALQAGGDFQIVFFFKEDSGRLRSDDITTMKLVIDAAKGQITQDHFAVVVNMCDEELLEDMEDDPEVRENYKGVIKDVCARRDMPSTNHVYFAPTVRALKRKTDATVQLDRDFNDFLDGIPVLRIDGSNVEDVRHEEYERALQAAAEASRAAEEAFKLVTAEREARNEAEAAAAREKTAKERALAEAADERNRAAQARAAHEEMAAVLAAERKRAAEAEAAH